MREVYHAQGISLVELVKRFEKVTFPQHKVQGFDLVQSLFAKGEDLSNVVPPPSKPFIHAVDSGFDSRPSLIAELRRTGRQRD